MKITPSQTARLEFLARVHQCRVATGEFVAHCAHSRVARAVPAHDPPRPEPQDHPGAGGVA